jgi:DNA repair exonuclease SbcCD ATPase subunit
VKRTADDKTNQLIKENNQLKNELNKVNLELEKLESNFTMQVDEYEVEIESISNKLKEKENTIKNLITSAEEKDSLIVKLKSKLIDSTETADQQMASELNALNKEQLKQRKIEGLLKLICEKNQKIEALKSELKASRTAVGSSSDDFSSCYTNSSASNKTAGSAHYATPINPPAQPCVKFLLDSLEKEVEIYQKLNLPDNKET